MVVENALMQKSGLQFSLVAVILLGTMTGCCGVIICQPPPAAPCDIGTLVIDEVIFPEGWEQQGSPRTRAAPARFGIERLGTTFSTPTSGVAVYGVYRAIDLRTAAAGYKDFMSYFSLDEGETEWSLPVDLAYRSPVADQSRLGCSTNRTSDVERCQFIGQYGVYLVRFHTYVSPDMMTYKDLELILQDIDRRMTECLNP
jgi:hypothetical protein